MNQTIQKGGKLATFLCLYIAQSIPMSFFSSLIPVLMRQQEFSLTTIGMLQFLKLPWVLKFLWSPAVDRSCNKVSDYKKWIFSSELIYAVIIFSISFLNFQVTPELIIGLIILAFAASATQDIATDALAVLSFNKKDKSLVNSMQSMGSFAGTLVGGGALLLLYKAIGWGSLLPYLALFVLIALIPLLFFKSEYADIQAKKKVDKPHPKDLLGFFMQKGIWKQLIFLFFYYAGIISILSMLRPMMVDLNYSVEDIAIIFGVVGPSVGCVSSLVGGFIIRKIGRGNARIIFACSTLLTTLFFFSLGKYLPISTATLHFGISLLWATYALSTIVVYTTAMDCVRKGYEGTDFTVQTVITHFSGMIMAALAGRIAQYYSYNTLFGVAVGIATFSLVYIILVFRNKNTITDESKSTK